eukprot:Rhum_TRINITY_DN14777_c7_g1::Rhum_TRINITY_DN14777_c7_g1_i1::g.115997::m.115997
MNEDCDFLHRVCAGRGRVWTLRGVGGGGMSMRKCLFIALGLRPCCGASACAETAHLAANCFGGNHSLGIVILLAAVEVRTECGRGHGVRRLGLGCVRQRRILVGLALLHEGCLFLLGREGDLSILCHGVELGKLLLLFPRHEHAGLDRHAHDVVLQLDRVDKPSRLVHQVGRARGRLRRRLRARWCSNSSRDRRGVSRTLNRTQVLHLQRRRRVCSGRRRIAGRWHAPATAAAAAAAVGVPSAVRVSSVAATVAAAVPVARFAAVRVSALEVAGAVDAAGSNLLRRVRHNLHEVRVGFEHGQLGAVPAKVAKQELLPVRDKTVVVQGVRARADVETPGVALREPHLIGRHVARDVPALAAHNHQDEEDHRRVVEDQEVRHQGKVGGKEVVKVAAEVLLVDGHRLEVNHLQGKVAH